MSHQPDTVTRDIRMAEIQLTEEEIGAALKVLRSGALRQGTECAAFEEEFARRVGAKHAVTCANGSASLHLAYLTFLQPGDEVLVPSFTFIATGSMVCAAGGTPVFCDVDPDSFLIDLEDAEQRITERTVAISPVHLFGNVCDIDAVVNFARKHSLKIVWDAAQAHGAEYRGRDIGGLDDFVSYSFYPSKNMFVGEGGMILSNDDEAAERLKYMRSHGQTGKYLHTMPGLNYRMTDVEAAIGREQLKRLDSMLEIRRRNSAIYDEALAALPGVSVQRQIPDTEHAVHQYCIVIDPDKSGISRDQLAEELMRNGVQTGVHYPRGLHQQPIFLDMYGDQQLPVTESLSQHILALPVHHGLSPGDVAVVATMIAGLVRGA